MCVIVGGGISALQLLNEISFVTRTSWVTRRPPEFREGPFDAEAGRAAVAIVEARVRQGLPPNSVVSVTGLRMTPMIAAMKERGVLERAADVQRDYQHRRALAGWPHARCRRDPLVHRLSFVARPSRAFDAAQEERRASG